jgi:hypothetical protein
MFSLMRDGALANAGDARLTLGEAQQHIDGEVSYYMGHGLGTLVATDQGVLIVTHDHWGDVLEIADVVEFRDASGRPLQTITGLEFRMSVLYRDSGTMVIVAPAGINLAPAKLGDSRQVPLERKVLITRQNPDGSGGVQVIEAEVKSAEIFEGRNAWMLDTLNGDALVRGDSGGGVWLEGKLVGNLWARCRAIENGWGLSGPKEVATSSVYAAQNPVQIMPAQAEALLNGASGTEMVGSPQASNID